MTIRGEVDTTELGNIFQMVAGLNHRSLLVIRPADEYEVEHRLLIEGDAVMLVSPPRHVPLAGLLVARGLIELERYFELRDRVEKSGVPLEDRLARGKPLDRELAGTARQLRYEEAILEALSWGRLVFRVRDGRDVQDPPSPRFRLDALLFEAARRVDERRKVELELETLIPVRVGDERDLGADRFSAIDRLVYAEVDGLRGLAQIESESGLPRLDAAQALRRLQAAGLVRAATSDELRPAIARVCRMGHFRVAARLGEAALAIAPKDLDLRAEIASTYDRLVEPGLANKHDLQRADQLEARGLREDLQRTLLQCWQRLPTDFRVLRRLGEVIAEDGALEAEVATRVTSDLRELATYQEEQGDLVSSLAVSRLALKLDPRHLGYGLEVARREEALGHLDEARRLLEHIASEQAAAGRLGAARATYSDLLRLAPDAASRYRKEIRAIDRIEGRLDDDPARLRGRKVAAAAAAACLLLAGALGSYLWRAQDALAGVLPPEPTWGDLQDPGAVADHLLAFGVQWPLTPAAAEAEEKAHALAELAAQRAAAAALERSATEASANERLLGVARLAEAAVRAGDVVRGLELLAEAEIDKAPAGEVKDRAHRLWNDLRAYIDQAEELRRRGDEARAKGRLDQAFASYQRLLERHGASPAARGISMPVRVVSVPDDATLVAPDGRRERGAIEIEVLPGSTAEVLIERPGARAERFEVHATHPWREHVHVQRMPVVRSAILAEAPVALHGEADGLWLLGASARTYRLRLGGDRAEGISEGREVRTSPLRVRGVGAMPWISAESGAIIASDERLIGRLPLVPGEVVTEALSTHGRLYARTSTGRVLGAVLGDDEVVGAVVPLDAPAERLIACDRWVLALHAGGRAQWVSPKGSVEPTLDLGSARVFEAGVGGKLLVALVDKLGELAAGSPSVAWHSAPYPAEVQDARDLSSGRVVLLTDGRLVFGDPASGTSVRVPAATRSIEPVAAERWLLPQADGGHVVFDAALRAPLGRLEGRETTSLSCVAEGLIWVVTGDKLLSAIPAR